MLQAKVSFGGGRTKEAEEGMLQTIHVSPGASFEVKQSPGSVIHCSILASTE